jgi:hypothetical protein
VLYGTITLSRFDRPGFAKDQAVRISARKTRMRVSADAFGSITLTKVVSLQEGEALVVSM